MREYMRKRLADPAYRKKHNDSCNRAAKRRYAQNPNPKRHAALKHSYGISIETFQALETAQGGVCAICRKPETAKGKKHLSVDHDHERGKGFVRGLLCTNCNNGLGRFGHDPERLQRAIAYLKGYEHAMSHDLGAIGAL